jgi:hypothetical protein
MEPMVGIEPTTYGLRNRCSTTELHWRLQRGVKVKRVQNVWQANFTPLSREASVCVCRFVSVEVDDMLRFGAQPVSGLVNEKIYDRAANWLKLLHDCLASAGGLGGAEESGDKRVSWHYSVKPYKYDGRPKRDERFPNPYNIAGERRGLPL